MVASLDVDEMLCVSVLIGVPHCRLTPTRYPPVVDPVELSSQSTPNFIKIEHSDDATRPRNRATPLVKQRPPPPSSHAEVQNSSVSVHSHYNAPIGASLTPQPMRRWPQRPSHHVRDYCRIVYSHTGLFAVLERKFKIDFFVHIVLLMHAHFSLQNCQYI